MRRPMKTFTTLITGLMAMIISSNAAALTVTVTGTPGAGTTTFTFAGSSTVTSGSSYFPNILQAGDENAVWYDLGAFLSTTTIANQSLVASTSYASVSSNGIAADISGLYLDVDTYNTSGPSYNFGIYLPDNVTGLPFDDGDVVSWSGSLTIDLDFSNFVAGTYSSNSIIAGPFDTASLDMTLVVSDPAQVPLPAAAPLFAIGLATSFGLYRRKRKAISLPR